MADFNGSWTAKAYMYEPAQADMGFTCLRGQKIQISFVINAKWKWVFTKSSMSQRPCKAMG